jgi:hypothetical protein
MMPYHGGLLAVVLATFGGGPGVAILAIGGSYLCCDGGPAVRGSLWSQDTRNWRGG